MSGWQRTGWILFGMPIRSATTATRITTSRPYRDYVIDAFNDGMPLDQFTREQLAGDLLPNSTVDQKIASGYNRLLQTSHEGGVQPKEYLSIYAADRVRNLSSVWLGGTLGCAQCHDHKFDPYTTKDFYSIVSFFADLDEAQHFTKGGNSLPTARAAGIDRFLPNASGKRSASWMRASHHSKRR